MRFQQKIDRKVEAFAQIVHIKIYTYTKEIFTYTYIWILEDQSSPAGGISILKINLFHSNNDSTTIQV